MKRDIATFRAGCLFTLLFSLTIAANQLFARSQSKKSPVTTEDDRRFSDKEDSAYIRDNYIKLEKLIPMEKESVELLTVFRQE